jgi:hypothetical protein
MDIIHEVSTKQDIATYSIEERHYKLRKKLIKKIGTRFDGYKKTLTYGKLG